MHIQVTYVHAPYLMTPLGFEWHGCLWAQPAWHLEMIQVSVDGKITATGRAGKFDTHLFQRSADTIGPKQGVLRQLLNLLDRLNINFARTFAGMGFIF